MAEYAAAAVDGNDRVTAGPVVVFIGSSEIFGPVRGKGFEGIPLNVIGEMDEPTSALLDHVEEIAAALPDTVVVIAGADEKLARRTVESVVDNMEGFLFRLRQELPTVRILVQSVPPGQAADASFRRNANRHLWQYAALVRGHFLDLWQAFASPDGQWRAEFTDDGRRLNTAGRETWIGELTSAIERVRSLPPSSRPLRIPVHPPQRSDPGAF